MNSICGVLLTGYVSAEVGLTAKGGVGGGRIGRAECGYLLPSFDQGVMLLSDVDDREVAHKM